MTIVKSNFRSNCLLEAIKAKRNNPNIRIIPVWLHEDNSICPHFIWTDGNYEYDFNTRGEVQWWRLLLHKGCIFQYPMGTFERLQKAYGKETKE